MSKNTITSLFASTIFLLLTAMTCEMQDDNFQYKLISLEVDNLDNSGKYITEAGDIINKEAFVLGVKEFVLYNKSLTTEPMWSTEPQLLKKGDIKENTIVNIKGGLTIFANSDFNPNYRKGSDITKLFVKHLVREYVTKDKHTPKGYSYFLILKEIPDVGKHSFKLVYEVLDNEENVVYITKEISLN